ncbi:flagellar FliL protein [Rhodopseudomonas rhenobacensis]|uniref:Flagellar protein FliL n=1 Tax=Rhodopseudomonas rhenobacensis TaxID=87461 RepID=A0A7W7Z3V5_9BRAD|nr:flagellar basal body-associated protein FliL [Rhodopseudomonas rhenobacensis]MBB5047528.1 flagellar FliL protein [Rhodopseudomonas rhenobacensis]
MAETEVEEGKDGEAAPKSKRKLFIIIGAVVGLLAIGGGTWFMFFRGHGAEETHKVEVVKPVFIDVPEMTINLAGMPGERIQYLRVKAVLEVKDEKVVEQIKPAMPRVTDIFQTYLRELRSSDISGSAGLFRLKEEMLRRVNLAVAPAVVNVVLFKEIVIQ